VIATVLHDIYLFFQHVMHELPTSEECPQALRVISWICASDGNGPNPSTVIEHRWPASRTEGDEEPDWRGESAQ
jgi:hypothetical protein